MGVTAAKHGLFLLQDAEALVYIAQFAISLTAEEEMQLETFAKLVSIWVKPKPTAIKPLW